MTPEAQRIAIAEACGWKQAEGVIKNGFWVNGIYVSTILSDLNAMHEAEKVLKTTGNWILYIHELSSFFRRTNNALSIAEAKNSGQVDYWAVNLVSATAAQRAQAFLKTLNLWTESEQGSGVLT